MNDLSRTYSPNRHSRYPTRDMVDLRLTAMETRLDLHKANLDLLEVELRTVRIRLSILEAVLSMYRDGIIKPKTDEETS